jgi:predicted restriction endonuclease
MDACEVCEWSEESCDVHHIDGDHFNNALENLVTLCPNHHRVADRALREGYVPAWLAVLKLAS